MTARRLGVIPSGLVVAAAALAGLGCGWTGHAVLVDDGGTTTGVRPAPSPTASPTVSATSDLLSEANVLAEDDLALIGWRTVHLDVIGDGEPQFAYSCQRDSLTGVADPAGVISADWTRGQSLTAGETVAELDSPPQAATLYRRLVRWYDTCTSGGAAISTARFAEVSTADGSAKVWLIGRFPGLNASYSILARSSDRVALVDLYGDATRIDRDGLAALARATISRLG